MNTLINTWAGFLLSQRRRPVLPMLMMKTTGLF